MAHKRAFSKTIIDTDAFQDMSQTAQLLYFYFNMNADDDGFVGNPKRIMRSGGFADDDFKILLAKRFLLAFENGVIVIKHWLIHNTIRKDRYTETSYIQEKNTLEIKENKAYTEQKETLATKWQPTVTQMATQDKIREDKIREDKIERHISFLQNIPPEVIKEFSEKFNVYEKGIKSKADDLYNYCKAKGKKYSDYKAFLRNALKKDFGERPPEDLEIQARIRATQEKSGISSSFAKGLAEKMSFKK